MCNQVLEIVSTLISFDRKLNFSDSELELELEKDIKGRWANIYSTLAAYKVTPYALLCIFMYLIHTHLLFLFLFQIFFSLLAVIFT